MDSTFMSAPKRPCWGGKPRASQSFRNCSYSRSPSSGPAASAKLGYGYNIRYLYTKISDLLGVSAGYKAVIIGAGNLGKALAATHMFERRGVARLGMFDVNPDLVGKCVYGTPVYHIDELYDFCIANGVSIGVLTVPKESAAEITDILYKVGVKGVWNFANMELSMEDQSVVVENIHLGDSLMTLGYRIKESAPALGDHDE